MRISGWRPLSVVSALLAVVPSLVPNSAPSMTADAVLSTATLMDMMAEMPSCGLTCSISEISKRCSALTDVECICTNEGLREHLTECIQAACTPIEAIKVARIDADICGTGHKSRQYDNLYALVIEIPAFFAVGFRLWTRWTALGRFEYDDWAMVVGWPLYTVFLIMGQYCNSLAFGRDIWNVPEDDLTLALKLFYIDESFYLAIMSVTKLSVTLFLLRIFPQRRFRMIAWTVFGFVFFSNAIFILLQIFQCTPIDFNWKGWRGDYGPHRCINVNLLSYTHSSFSIAHDVIVMILPMPLVWGLNMGWRQKTGIIFMFSLGVFIVTISCVRLQYMISFARSTNPTWDYTDALLWSGVEAAVAVIVTSLPAISVFLTNRFPRIFGSRGSSDRSGNNAFAGVNGNSNPIKTFGSSQPTDGPDRSRSRMRAALSSTRIGGGRSRRRNQNSVFSLFEGDDSSQGNESQLELGERIKGDVHTDIACGSTSPIGSEGGYELSEKISKERKGSAGGGSGNASGSDGNGDSIDGALPLSYSQGAIHVRTTTVTQSSEWTPGAFGRKEM